MEGKIMSDKDKSSIINNFPIINNSKWSKQDKEELLWSSILDNIARIAQEHRDFYES